MLNIIRKIKVKELLLAVIITSGFICDWLQQVLNIQKNANVYVLGIEVILIIMLILQSKKDHIKVRINLLCLYVFVSFLLLYIISYYKYGSQYYTIIQMIYEKGKDELGIV